MSYKVYYRYAPVATATATTEVLVYDPVLANQHNIVASHDSEQDYVMLDAKMSLAVNSVGSFVFTLPPENKAVSVMRVMYGLVKVTEVDSGSEVTIFCGRIASISKRWDGCITYTCEGSLANLNDVPLDKGTRSYASPYAMINGILTTVHNVQCRSLDRQIFVGASDITVTGSISRQWDKPASIWQRIVELTESELGGYVLPRYSGYDTYIQYLASLPSSSATVEFGENLLDLTDAYDGTGMVTGCVPVGKDGLTISSVTTGSYDEFYKSGIYLFSTEHASSTSYHDYGLVAPVVEFTDVTTVDDLLAKAKTWLRANISTIPRTLTIKAVDLHQVSSDEERIKVGTTVLVKSTPHGINTSMIVSAVDIDLLDASQNTIELGKEIQTMTSRSIKTNSDLAEMSNLRFYRNTDDGRDCIELFDGDGTKGMILYIPSDNNRGRIDLLYNGTNRVTLAAGSDGNGLVRIYDSTGSNYKDITYATLVSHGW